MTTRSRILLAAAALLLGLMYLFPIWHISLDAPQYPEGIGMYIHINTITGENPNDLQNINGLNHYIGMKRIEPDSITELKLMPWIIGALIALGLAAAAGGKRWMLYTWVGLFLVTAATGLVDFYLWEYDYGHDLDPTAAIQVPGMTYQPPLIGSKQLLNFTAHSWPALGGIAAFVSMALGLVAVFFEFRRKKTERAPAVAAPAAATKKASGRSVVAAAVLPLLLFAACSSGPQPIHYGEEQCAHCRMTISDSRYGAELVTTKGKALKFDSIECLAAHLQNVEAEAIGSLWVTDFQHPETLIPAEEAFFLHGGALHSPMGGSLTAFGLQITPTAAQNSFGGTVLTDWSDVLTAAVPHDTVQPVHHPMPH